MVEERGAGSQGWQFFRFLEELLAALPGVTELEAERGGALATDVRADFVARFEGRPLLLEAKVTTPQTPRRLREMIWQLQQAWTAYEQLHGPHQEPRLVVAFPGVLSQQRQTVVRAASVEIWDGAVLQRMARAVGVDTPEFLAIPEEEEPAVRREPADELLRRLDAIPAGKTGWQAFEQFSEDLLNLLFVPPLNTVIPQSSTENGVNRRDFVLPNYAPADSFWGFLRVHYPAATSSSPMRRTTRGRSARRRCCSWPTISATTAPDWSGCC
ncbi:hypothetical protein [Dactylosporangium sp. CA-092794]|uniref:hypothetical protein n=1 Tax=Dactylosporangium sp. CA-092794 TaxID=3239929 RepID=UPI003D940424